MDDKIEAWRNGLLQLVLKHARLYSDHEDAGVVEAAYVAICDYLRTTPEGYRLAPVKPTAAMIAAGVAEADFYKTPTFQAEATYLAMLAASQESGT